MCPAMSPCRQNYIAMCPAMSPCAGIISPCARLEGLLHSSGVRQGLRERTFGASLTQRQSLCFMVTKPGRPGRGVLAGPGARLRGVALLRAAWRWLATCGDFAGDCCAVWLVAPQFRAVRACRLRHVLVAGLLVKNAVNTAHNENTNMGGG
jgi:hypothetical protein